MTRWTRSDRWFAATGCTVAVIAPLACRALFDGWTPLDDWIVAIGCLTAVACGLLGNFLILRRMSMMGDAISHAVLPGLAIAFLVTGSRDSVTMFVGAAAVGVLTAVLTQWIHAWGGVDENASMGVVFTTLFAIGLILMVRAADAVDLDPGCVLYGAIEYAPLDLERLGAIEVPRAALVMGVMLLVNVAFVAVFFKELRISAFDPALAETLGMRPRAVHYLLMMLIAASAVAAFEAVGSILVVAMLIVPGATAHLLTDRLGPMIVIGAAIGAIGAATGHVAAITIPTWLGFGDTSSAGMMVVATGALFVAALVAAPRHGIASRLLSRAGLTLQIVREDIIGFLYRLEELGAARRPVASPGDITDALGARPLAVRLALASLRRTGRVRRDGAGFGLTDEGRHAGRRLVRTHRLWEAYLEQHLDVPPDHLHGPAMQLEHVTDEAMRRRLAEATDRPRFDPHGRRVPEEPPDE